LPFITIEATREREEQISEIKLADTWVENATSTPPQTIKERGTRTRGVIKERKKGDIYKKNKKN
jgi:hypothetical protein